MPLSICSQCSAKGRPDPVTRSRSSPVPAFAATRAPMCTVRPLTLPACHSTSPACSSGADHQVRRQHRLSQPAVRDVSVLSRLDANRSTSLANPERPGSSSMLTDDHQTSHGGRTALIQVCPDEILRLFLGCKRREQARGRQAPNFVLIRWHRHSLCPVTPAQRERQPSASRPSWLRWCDGPVRRGPLSNAAGVAGHSSLATRRSTLARREVRR